MILAIFEENSQMLEDSVCQLGETMVEREFEGQFELGNDSNDSTIETRLLVVMFH
jgi:hypothetical protein